MSNTLRTIIAGSRTLVRIADVEAAMASCPWSPSVVISGSAPGADRLGERWAASRGLPVERYPADWATLGKSAGHVRNAQMASVADALVAVWDGESPGTRNMISVAKEAGLRVHVHEVKKPEPEYRPTSRPVAVFDIEVYSDYFEVGFKTVEGRKLRQFEMFAGHPLDVDSILRICATYTVVGFNSIDFDCPVLFYTLSLLRSGQHDIETVLLRAKWLSDRIISRRMRAWQVYKELGFEPPEWLDHIDLMEAVPGVQIGLKLYAARLHSKLIQDLPYAPNEPVFGWPDEDRRAKILTYNDRTDLDATIELWLDATKPGDNIIETRVNISKEFGIDVRSKSDAQIAEAAIKREVCALKGIKSIYRSEITPGTVFRYQPPSFLHFKTPLMQRVYETVVNAQYVVNENGGIDMPAEIKTLRVAIGRSVYQMGIGGLHSTESRQAIRCLTDEELIDIDGTSFYPYWILKCALFPPNMGEDFQKVYKKFYDLRVAAKKAGNKSFAQTYKIILNGAYGKLGSWFSVLYAPNLMIQVTLTGQLALLMMIESMELAGIPVVSANTDGIVTKVHKSQRDALQAVVDEWVGRIGMDVEYTHYKALFSRDVNTYVAVKTDGKVKRKGGMAASDTQHNPSNEIVKTAVVEFLAKGVPIAETILKCRDVRQFLSVQRVTGGAQLPTEQKWVDDWVEVLPRHWAKRSVIDAGGDYYKSPVKRVSRPPAYLVTTQAQYLGKVVRWIRSTKSRTAIHYVKNNNKVPGSDNAWPLMELPDQLPDHIDYAYYIQEAYSMLADLGVMQ